MLLLSICLLPLVAATAGHDGGFLVGALSSFAIIVVSEIGDKTFFIAALLALKRGALVTFLGAASALIIMTVLSAVAGRALPALIDRKYTQVAGISLFLVFGIKLLYEAKCMSADSTVVHEMEEVEKDLMIKREIELTSPEEDLEADKTDTSKKGGTPQQTLLAAYTIGFRALVRKNLPSAFAEAFALTFAAEWGDRSQIATISLGASHNIWGVSLGACLGHIGCTAIASISGKLLASKISERTVTAVGGLTFLFFALAGAFAEVHSALSATGGLHIPAEQGL